MMNSAPRITVLMPAFNAGKYIGEAIQSVLNQSFADFELLIINDGSTDNTAQIISGFNDPRIRTIEQPGSGISMALNAGLHSAKGEYIARFDADDICFPERLKTQVEFLDSHPEYILTGSDAEYIQENGEHLFDHRCGSYAHEDIVQTLHEYCPFIHSSVMYRKEPVLQTGGYSPFAHNFEDYLLWVNLIKSGRCCNLPYSLIKVRFNPVSVTIDEKWRGRSFRTLKRRIIRQGFITEKEGDQIRAIIKKQETRKIKEGSYHALCSKKFLTDNYQPAKARWHAGRAIRIHPLRLDNYALLLAGFLPAKWIKWLNRKNPYHLY